MNELWLMVCMVFLVIDLIVVSKEAHAKKIMNWHINRLLSSSSMLITIKSEQHHHLHSDWKDKKSEELSWRRTPSLLEGDIRLTD